MAADPMGPTGARQAHGPLRFGPGPTGWAVLVAAVVLVVWVATVRRLAVGFLIPIVALAVVDGVLGARAVRRRGVRISAVRSVVASPDTVTLRVTSDPGAGPARLLVGPMRRDEPPVSLVLPSDGSARTIAWAEGFPYVTYVVRHLIESTRLGLVVVRRYTVTELPAGAWRIGPPVGLTVDEPPAGEELTRLREYVPGDRLSRVSWPTTAHTGRLHVRAEDVDPAETIVVVDCGTTASEAETALRFAAGVVTRLLDAGGTVRLITRTLRPSFYRDVADRLLSAPGRSPDSVVDEMAAAAGGADAVVDSWVTTREDMIRRLALAELGPPLPSPGPHIRIDADGARAAE